MQKYFSQNWEYLTIPSYFYIEPFSADKIWENTKIKGIVNFTVAVKGISI